jgi:hypothetical protein
LKQRRVRTSSLLLASACDERTTRCLTSSIVL